VVGLFQYDQYRDLRLAENLAAEDLQDAKLNAEDQWAGRRGGFSFELREPDQSSH
jgi:hypothetical protein